MTTSDDNVLWPATDSPGEERISVPESVIPLLTTRCLATAMVLQILAVTVPALGRILLLGLILAVIGLGACACVRSGRIENGWAFIGLIPFLGLLIGCAVLRLRQPQPDAALNALRGAVHAALVGVVFMATAALVLDFTQRGTEIRGEVPDNFPVLAVVPEDDSSFTAHIVPMRDLEEFAREHPGLSFRVPKQLEASLNDSLQRGTDGLFHPSHFEVSEMSGHRQALEVRYPIHQEAYSVGWYEATEYSIEPKRYLFFHEMMLGFIVFPMLIVSAVVYSLLSWLLNRMLWPRFATSTIEQ